MSKPNATSPTSSPIPFIYRLLFTYIDPLFCLMGFSLHIIPSLQPTTLQGYSPYASAISVSSTKTTTTVPLLLENLAGFFLTLGVLQAVLLRLRPDDVVVWRCVQGSVFLLEVIMVWTHSKALTVEGRWDVGQWRGDDWRNIAGNVSMGLPRLCCALAVGFRDRAGKEKAT